jgi:hypothetical protein
MNLHRTITLPRRGVLLRVTRFLGVASSPGKDHSVFVPGPAPAGDPATDSPTLRNDGGSLGERLAQAHLLCLGRRPMVSLPRVA